MYLVNVLDGYESGCEWYQTKRRDTDSMAYEFLNKDVQRSVVYSLYRRCATQKPIVFLDDESAGACTFFLAEGVPKEHVHPVNFSRAHADTITRKSGITCACDDIDSHLTTLSDDVCSVVWLDYTRITIDVDVLRDALRVAPNVSVTLSLRGVGRADNEKHIRKLVKKIGTLMQFTTYKGKGGVENMLSFIVSRVPLIDIAPHPHVPETAMDTMVEENTESMFTVDDSVVVEWRRDTFLTGVVLEVRESHVRVVFDCDGVEKWMPLHKVEPNRKVHTPKTLNALVGQTLLVPSKLWSTKTGYEDVKVVGKKLAFKVIKRYYNGDRYTIAGISKRNGLPLRKKETWTLTYEQASCYSTM